MREVLLLLVFVFACKAVVNDTHLNALLDLFNATNGKLWINKANWGVGDPCDNSWQGILCNTNQIEYCHLTNNNLNGSIPSSIGDLSYLTILNLSQNVLLSGTIPPAIGLLTRLTELYLDQCALEGSIPSDIGNLVLLQDLYIGNSPMNGTIPSSFASLTSLSQLYIARSQVSGTIPEFIGTFTKLQYLSLVGNALSGTIPSSFQQWTTIGTLELFAGNSLCNGCLNFINMNKCFVSDILFACNCPSSICNNSCTVSSITCPEPAPFPSPPSPIPTPSLGSTPISQLTPDSTIIPQPSPIPLSPSPEIFPPPPCSGNAIQYGTCNGLWILEPLKIDNNNLTLKNVNGFVIGTIQPNLMILEESNVTINGDLKGRNTKFILSNTVITLKDMNVVESEVLMDVHSIIWVQGNLNMRDSTIIVTMDLQQISGEITLILAPNSTSTTWPNVQLIYLHAQALPCKTFHPKQNKTILSIVETSVNCGDHTSLIIGVTVGVFLVLAFVFGISYQCYQKQIYKKSLQTLLKKAQSSQ